MKKSKVLSAVIAGSCFLTYLYSSQIPEHELTVVVTKGMLSGIVDKNVRIIPIEAFQHGFRPDRIVVKKGEKVRLELTSADVAHGFGVEELGINVRIRPGKTVYHEFIPKKSGEFHVHCTEYCGPGHAKMRATLIVLE